MGLLTRAVVGRWLARWLLRGGPLAIAAKLLAVGALGAWKYHRERKRSAELDPQRIEADYEVLGPERIAPVSRSPGRRRDASTGGGAEPDAGAKGSWRPEVDEDPTLST